MLIANLKLAETLMVGRLSSFFHTLLCSIRLLASCYDTVHTVLGVMSARGGAGTRTPRIIRNKIQKNLFVLFGDFIQKNHTQTLPKPTFPQQNMHHKSYQLVEIWIFSKRNNQRFYRKVENASL
jgi:hypothetical protein